MKIFVLAHTHWDREWFLTSEYTNRWLVVLFERLFKLLEEDMNFVFILDGQTLIIEDLLNVKPEFKRKVEKYVSEGRLIIGPVYAQIDWRISPEFTIWKNFSIGKKDVEKFKGQKFSGWFMDNFGQFAQLPQILKHFEIDHAFIWRGISFGKDKESIIFKWKAPDGTEVIVYYLLWGYRNLYNIQDTLNILDERLEHEIDKIKKFTNIIVLFDGYDLDLHPENPRKFLNFETCPLKLLEEFKKLKDLPEYTGEMISGKYACVFPGTLSTRSYLKVASDVIGRLLQYLSLFNEDGEDLWREYLKTLIHDNICGVGVDQVHEKMEVIYKNLHKNLVDKLKRVLSGFNLDGLYAFVPVQYDIDVHYAQDEGTYHIKADGAGIWKTCKEAYKPSKNFEFQNDYYKFRCDDSGFYMNDKKICELIVERESGDAYSSWTEPMSLEVRIKNLVSFKNGHAMKIEFERILNFECGHVETFEKLFLDDSPIIRWEIEIFPNGVGYKLKAGIPDLEGKILAKMPFYYIEREEEDRDLLPEKLEGELGEVLLAAREVERIVDFPFQDVVFKGSYAILSLGLREYSAVGGLWVTLLRSVEWITKKDVKGRTGDAGPVMYVPGARCERKQKLELGFMIETDGWEKWVEFFSKPPVIFSSTGKERRNVPFKGIKKRWIGVECGEIIYLEGSKIKKSIYKAPGIRIGTEAEVKILCDLNLNFEEDTYKPDKRILKGLKNKISRIENELDSLKRNVKKLKGLEYHKTMHKILSLERERLETKLSILLNEERVGLYRREEIEKVGLELNEARRKRRTYDYILAMYEGRRR